MNFCQTKLIEYIQMMNAMHKKQAKKQILVDEMIKQPSS